MHAGATVAVVSFEGISPFHLSVPCLVFGEDRADAGIPRFDTCVCSWERGSLGTRAGFRIEVNRGLEVLAGAHIIVVPSWHDDLRPAPPVLLEALRAAHSRGAMIMGLCLGAFVLAEAGLLDGRPATTHWHFAAQFAHRYPKVRLNADVLYVDDGTLLTSAGTAAGLDCCLHLMRRLCGSEVANRAARRMVVAPHRQGNQAQFIAMPVRTVLQGDRLSELLDWMSQHLDEPHSIDALARRVGMSRRTLTRRFREATGTTVGRWLQGQRLALAQRLLETTRRSIDHIAVESGFGSALSMRQVFAAVLDTSPSMYRREFQGFVR